jgi:hypothetical protein
MKKLTGKNICDDILLDMGIAEVGIFESKQIKIAKNKKAGLKNVGSSKARLISNKQSDQTTADNLERLENKYKLLSKPLDSSSSDYNQFMDAWINLACDNTPANLNKAKNSLKATIIKPVLNSAYGFNTTDTVKRKGFNKLMIDTGQTLKALEVKIKGK